MRSPRLVIENGKFEPLKNESGVQLLLCAKPEGLLARSPPNTLEADVFSSVQAKSEWSFERFKISSCRRMNALSPSPYSSGILMANRPIKQ